ncbi:MAG: tetratricopeptide repeat protein, partial [Calditerrivibrio sp.]|uniref:tetratricopeptide repeat protein n=1 Tax=Calditerrivibrio sp. TaxID=2792612 RepID=UPI003D14BBE3
MKNPFMMVLIIITMFTNAFAEAQSYTHSVKKILGSSQSFDDAKVAAVADAKREIIEKAGTYIESLTIVQDGELKKDEISAMALGVMKTEIISVKKGMEGDAIFIEVTVRSEVDVNSLKDKINAVKSDKSTLAQYQQFQKNMSELLNKFKELEKKNQQLESEMKIITAQKSIKTSNNYATNSEKKKIDSIKKEQDKVNVEFKMVANKLESDSWAEKADALWDGNGYSDKKLAMYYFDKAIELNPESDVAYLGKGLVYYGMKDYTNALKAYNKAISINPTYAYAYNNRALVYFYLKNYNAAKYDYSKAINYDPDYALAYNNRGLLYYEIGDYKSSLEDFNKSIELNPNYTPVYY